MIADFVEEIERLGAVVMGVSEDGLRCVRSFKGEVIDDPKMIDSPYYGVMLGVTQNPSVSIHKAEQGWDVECRMDVFLSKTFQNLSSAQISTLLQQVYVDEVMPSFGASATTFG